MSGRGKRAHWLRERPVRSDKCYRVHFLDDGWTMTHMVRTLTEAFRLARQIGREHNAVEVWKYYNYDYRDGGGMSGSDQMFWYDGRKLRRFS